MTKYKNKYRSVSARHPYWDYSSNSMYFITICTKNRFRFFGTIREEKMQHTEIGKIVENEWMKSPGLRPDMNLLLGEFVVMPDHFHAIIIIGGEDAMHRIFTSVVNTKSARKNKFGPQSKNLASIIRGFKSSVTIQARKINPNFAWQPRFHDHIIRNEKSFHRIQNYIKNNPTNWGK